jgi:dethiobiotin synthetase
LFITGTDTEVGKTYVTCLIAEYLFARGHRVGVYKPVASGCRADGEQDVSDDAWRLWRAAGQPLRLDDVCPQRFVAPLAPHLAAAQQECQVDEQLLSSGIDVWNDQCDVMLVEGAGGLLSPLTDSMYVADLAIEFGYPLVVVAPNRLGTINQTLQTLIAASTYRGGLQVAGVVLNDLHDASRQDASCPFNRGQLQMRCSQPLLAHVAWGQQRLDETDWYQLARKETTY